MISLRDVVTGFKVRDPLAEVWRRDLRGGGSAEITGTLPLRYIGNGKPLTDYLISGNTVQDGTPTPEAPVDVVGCGVRTENLFDKNTTVYNAYVNSTESKWYIVTDISRSIRIPVSGNTQYTLSISEPNAIFRIYETSIDNPEPSEGGTLLSEIVTGKNMNQYTFTTASDTKFIVFQGGGSTVDAWLNSLMLNLGSTALPYEPYGYKLSPTVNGTEYPIYLGEVESTRRIKKLVLTGNETWSTYTVQDGSYCAFLPLQNFMGSETASVPAMLICTHYISRAQNAIYNGLYKICCGGRTNQGLLIRDVNITSETDFKSYLAAQYAAGTPVTIWYVLATPETAIVNEPLMKIGDYADTISFAQAGVTIPTVSGSNVLGMTSPVKPSEVYIKGSIKPTNNPNFENGG